MTSIIRSAYFALHKKHTPCQSPYYWQASVSLLWTLKIISMNRNACFIFSFVFITLSFKTIGLIMRSSVLLEEIKRGPDRGLVYTDSLKKAEPYFKFCSIFLRLFRKVFWKQWWRGSSVVGCDGLTVFIRRSQGQGSMLGWFFQHWLFSPGPQLLKKKKKKSYQVDKSLSNR